VEVILVKCSINKNECQKKSFTGVKTGFCFLSTAEASAFLRGFCRNSRTTVSKINK